jgi:hypothetical protein
MALDYEIKENYISINTDSKWTLELNLVSWNHKAPKYDLRKWDETHESMSKGITLTEDEVVMLFQESENFLKKIGMLDTGIPKDTGEDIKESLPFD